MFKSLARSQHQRKKEKYMRTKSLFPLIVLAVVVTVAFSFTHMGVMNEAWGCGWGSPGGRDFGPQARYQPTPSRSGKKVTQNQAYDILSGHLARLNPNLKLGKSIDAGTHYEFEVLVEGKSVDRLAVDKSSGMIRPVN
jgi:hypothetical protein